MSNKDKKVENGLSFIEKLPDCVLHRIVSHLPYKEASRTAILSDRWSRVLPSSRVVDFDERKLGFLGQNSSTNFSHFAQNLMDSYKEPLMDKISITFSVSSPKDFAKELRDCLVFAVAKKVKVILLDFGRVNRASNGFDLPEEVYGHKGLETLRLFSCGFVGSKFKGFDSLLDVSLGWIAISTASLRDLVGNCASLKNLSLKKCWNTSIIEIQGQGLGLESLVIDDCDVANDWITISAPNLKILKYSGTFRTFEIDQALNLEEAVFDFGIDSGYGELGDLLYQLFRDLYAVKKLTICSYSLQIIPSGEEPIKLKPRLECLKHLILKTAMHVNEFYGIRFFLNSCPSLETLTIEIDPDRIIFEEYESPFEEKGNQSMPVYTCVKRTLKTIEVKGFRGEMDEISLLAYFISLGRALENLDIKICEDLDVIRLQRASWILNTYVKKASPNVQISIS